MKKFITVAALLAAGTAFANATESDYTFDVQTGGNFYAGEYTFSFIIDEVDLSATDTSDVLAVYWGEYNAGNYYSNGFVLNYDSNGDITLTVGRGAMGNLGNSADVAKISENTTFVFGTDTSAPDSKTFAAKLKTGILYTIVNSVDSDAKQNVTLTGGTLTQETVVYKGNMYGGNANTSMQSRFNQDYAATAVPEPSAFGLLAGIGALALVASRRRRK